MWRDDKKRNKLREINKKIILEIKIEVERNGKIVEIEVIIMIGKRIDEMIERRNERLKKINEMRSKFNGRKKEVWEEIERIEVEILIM